MERLNENFTVDKRTRRAHENLAEALEQIQADQAKTNRTHMTPSERRMIDGLRAEIKRIEAEPDERCDGEDYARGWGAGMSSTTDDTPKHFYSWGHPRSESRGGQWKNFGEYLDAMRRAAMQGGIPDDRLVKELRASGAHEGVPSAGGFAVSMEFLPRLLGGAIEQSTIARLCTPLPVGENFNGVSLPLVDEESRATGSRFGGVRAYWVGEGTAATASKPKIRLVNESLVKLAAVAYVTAELAEDSEAFGAMLEIAFQEEMAFMLDDSIVRGTGAGQPLGILNSGALVTVNAEVGQTASNPWVVENLLKMAARLPAKSQQRAVWLYNVDCLPHIWGLGLQQGLGGSTPLMLAADKAAGRPHMTLFGMPMLPCEQCETCGTTGDIILLDPSMYVLADKGGVRADSSIHVKFVEDEVCYKWTHRCQGQPLRNTTLTPYKGSDEQSPFIVLAARS